MIAKIQNSMRNDTKLTWLTFCAIRNDLQFIKSITKRFTMYFACRDIIAAVATDRTRSKLLLCEILLI
jgi:hypothetical protein